MACTECCHCCHEPPEGTSRAQVKLATDLAKLADTKPKYTRGKYRPYAYIGDYSLRTPGGSYVKSHVWREEVTHDDSHRMVTFEGTLTPEDALAVFAVLWKNNKRRPKVKL